MLARVGAENCCFLVLRGGSPSSRSKALTGKAIFASVGGVVDGYGNALAETINDVFKTEVIWRRGSTHSMEAIEFRTVDWFNPLRLLEPITNIPPIEAEATCYAAQEPTAMAA